jgi:phytoene dehydrogenase-like protein
MHTIVVGAGIAGLWIAEQLAKLGDEVMVLEKADYLGGRVLTSDLGYEIGAGRVATNHRRVLRLVRRFGLETFPHGPGYAWKTADTDMRSNDFDVVWSQIVRLIAKFDAKTLGTHTLRELGPLWASREDLHRLSLVLPMPARRGASPSA